MSTDSFLNLIKSQREKKSKKTFKGTLLEYLDVVKDEPSICDLSHKRLYETITLKGTGNMEETDPRCRKLFGGEKIPIYDYFSSQFFGMERSIAKIMRFLKSASMRGEESRQVLLLLGPVGSGKSALMEHLKRSLETADHVYHLEGCPIREEPLHLIPRSLRSEFSELLGVNIEGDLCPVCRWKLLNEYDGKYENFPVVRSSFSVRARRGIGVVPPIDANTQDVSILVGTEDISKLDKYSEDDPRVLSLNGAFNVGNRGIVEFVEIFKNEIEFLHTIITATQEKMVSTPGKNAMVYIDSAILSHCNEAEWNKFKSDHANEAILDRIVKIEVPYCLEKDEEVKIYQKILSQSDFDAHIAPHTLEIASLFSVMSRLSHSDKVDVLTKSKIYNGEEIVETGHVRKIDIEDLREEEKSRREGMTGISTRFVMKAIDNALSDSTKNIITPISVRESLIRQVKEQVVDQGERDRYLELLQKVIHEEYLKILEKEIAKAFVTSYEEQAKTLFKNYLDHAEAFVNKTKVKDGFTSESAMEPDENFMTSIEEQIGIVGSSTEGFRSDVMSYMFSKMRMGQEVKWDTYTPLKSAIENKLISSVRDIARLVTKAKARDRKDQKKYSDMVSTLIEQYGYNEDSAEEILSYASNHLWRDN